MLVFFHRLARRLWPLRRALWAVAIAGALAFAWVLATGTGGRSSVWLMLSALALLWALSLVFVAATFARPAPEVEAGDRWWRRLGKRLRRLGLWLAAVWVTGLTGALAWLSLRAARIALADLG